MWPWPAWMFEVHRISAWALIALSPWKVLVAIRSLRRGLDRRFNRSWVIAVSLLLATAVIGVLVLGLLWTWRVGPERPLWYQTMISWHWYLALALIATLVFHVWQRWPRPRRADFTSRRSAIKLLGLGVAGVGFWAVAETLSRFRQDPLALRRYSGSREDGSFTGLGYPVNNMLGEGKIVLDPQIWQLKFSGNVATPLVLDYEQILAMPSVEKTVTLDCTDGWYSTQVWRGVPLADLLQLAGTRRSTLGVELKAASGYFAVLSMPEAADTILATHAGGVPFDHWHGAPLRAVVPARRGWQWVKWLVRIKVL